MSRPATHRQADLARALRAARKDAGNWQVELLPNGAIVFAPAAYTAPKQKRLPPPVAHA